jgi:hypothetical protein
MAGVGIVGSSGAAMCDQRCADGMVYPSHRLDASNGDGGEWT